jgi:hypothetical protein
MLLAFFLHLFSFLMLGRPTGLLEAAPAQGGKRPAPSVLAAPLLKVARMTELAERRRNLMTSEVAVPGTTFLESRAISAKTSQDYRRRWEEFKEFIDREHLRTADIDDSLTLFMNMRYSLGYGSGDGTKLLASVVHHHPHLRSRTKELLPRANKALAGWIKMSPEASVVPMPMSIAMAMAVEMERIMPSVGLAFILGVDAYLRPCELLSLRGRDVIHPSPPSFPHVAVVVKDSDWRSTTKTGTMDESVRMDKVETSRIFKELLIPWAKARPPSSYLWTFNYKDMLKVFNSALIKLNIKGRWELYAMRHCGPSNERADNLRTLEESKRRGRWRSESSAARYEKHASLQAQWARTPAALQRHALLIRARFFDYLRVPSSAPRPPR